MVEAAGLKKITKMDGRLHIFQRPKTPFIWCGFHHKGKYVRKSTKETNFATATAVAEQWYLLAKAKILTGDTSIGGKSFSSAAKSALKNVNERAKRKERSQAYADSIELLLNSSLIPYFGSTSVESINIVAWERYKEFCREKNPNLSRGTLHQHKNALRVVLNHAFRNGWIKALPVFKDVYDTDKVKIPRQAFNSAEWTKLHTAIRNHKKTLMGTRWEEDCEELYDYVMFVANSGLRVGEAKNVRFCDCSIHVETIDGEDRKFVLIKNISGKRGDGGTCRTMDSAVDAFERRVDARGIKDPSKSEGRLFQKYHRDMFNTILEKTGLKYSGERPRRKRDLTVLRHTYITFRLREGTPIFFLANNCRTSPSMIDQHYARYLNMEGVRELNVRKWKPKPNAETHKKNQAE